MATAGTAGSGEHARPQAPATTGLAPGPEVQPLTGSLGGGPAAAPHGVGAGTPARRGGRRLVGSPDGALPLRGTRACRHPQAPLAWLGVAAEVQQGGPVALLEGAVCRWGLSPGGQEVPRARGWEGKGKLFISHVFLRPRSSLETSEKTPGGHWAEGDATGDARGGRLTARSRHSKDF